MKILSLEPTPSPNSMKLNIDETLPAGERYTYTKENAADAPKEIQQILNIEGVKSVYRVADFIAIDRYPKADWKEILAALRKQFAKESTESLPAFDFAAKDMEGYGEVKVLVQVLRGIPGQVKLLYGNEEARFGLPERFTKAIMKLQAHTSNYIYERQWVEQGVRYGDVREIGEQVVSEISAAYDEERLEHLLELAMRQEQDKEEALSSKDVSERMGHPDWEKRFAALERLDPTSEDLPILEKALQDPNVSIRRLAVVYLGMIGGKEVLPYLYKALHDSSVIVRRTAGDVLTDLGDPAAIPVMAQALSDPNKLVRWRAARYLYEVGDETALDALKDAQNDPEFEVALQIRMAIERIESGEEASGTVWQQMARGLSKENTAK